MAYKCNKTGKIIRDARKEGNGCPDHTEITDKGMSARDLRNYYTDRRDEFPNGRYSCSFCRWMGSPVD